MMMLLPFLLSLCIGMLALRLILGPRRLQPVFFLCLSVGLGAGMSAGLMFLTFLLADSYHRPLAWLLHGTVAAGLLPGALRGQVFRRERLKRPSKEKRFVLLSVLAAIAYFFFLYILVAGKNPCGSWDAWGIWNFKARFLFLNTSSWKVLLREMHWHTEPDYPLLLPLLNVWGWSSLLRPEPSIPLLTAVMFTFSCAGLLFFSLNFFIPRAKAFAAASGILFMSYYLFLATNQYADILIAYYLLAAVWCLVVALREKDGRLAFLCGVFLGFLSFTKNEGIIMAGLLFFLTAGVLLFEKKERRKIFLPVLGGLAAGLLATCWMTAVFKGFLVLANRHVHFGNIFVVSHYDILRGQDILDRFFKEVFSAVWFGVWFFLIPFAATHTRRLWKEESRIIFFFFLFYGTVIFAIYMTNPGRDLAWWLSMSLGRIFFGLLPAGIFFIFYRYPSSSGGSS